VVTTLDETLSVTETVTLGATFKPASGALKQGTYTATITARDPVTGVSAPVQWSFTVVAVTHKTYLSVFTR